MLCLSNQDDQTLIIFILLLSFYYYIIIIIILLLLLLHTPEAVFDFTHSATASLDTKKYLHKQLSHF